MGINATAQKHAQREMQSTDERTQMANRTANMHLWVWDLQTDQVFFSPVQKGQVG